MIGRGRAGRLGVRILGPVVGAALATTLACTLSPPSGLGSGPATLATNPIAGERGVPRNQAVSFWFDGPLDPASLGSGSITVTSREVRQGGRIRYDPIQWRLEFAPSGLFRRTLAYDAVIDHERLRGLRHGLPVHPASETFVPGRDELEPTPEPVVGFLEDVAPLFADRCAFAGCHASPHPIAGLDLSSPRGVASSAVGARTTTGWPGWPRVEAGSAAWSYLVYKVLAEETVRGGPMPPGSGLSPADVVAIVRWIDQGAEVDRDAPEP